MDKTKHLANGVEMPLVGLGVFKMTERDETIKAVESALKAGYRSIDTASYYFNEQEVGEAVRHSNIPRDEIFITTKVWNDDQGYDETLRAFEESLKRLEVDYIDLYLTHWPVPDKFIDTFRAIERLYEEKLIRVPGVSNHHEKHFRKLENKVNVKPMVNQIERHPSLQQRELVLFCEQRDIAVTAWAPLGRGELFEHEVIQSLARKHNKTPAQIILRWQLERDIIVIPKSVSPQRIQENFDLFNFQLDTEDIELINGLDSNNRFGADPSQDSFMDYFK